MNQNRDLQISVVVPIHNEQDNIMPLWERICAVLEKTPYSFEVILVDDGSHDQSLERLQTLAAKDPRVVVLELCRNYGQSAALDAGFTHARGEWIITMDADLQNDPDDIPMLIAKLLEGYDVVTGHREKRQDKFISRKIPSWVANFIIRRVAKTKTQDLGCSLRIMRRQIIKNLQLYGEMHRFIIPLAEALGARVCEVPVKHHSRFSGTSKYGWSRTAKVMLDLSTLVMLKSYRAKPMYLFGGAGMLLMLFSFIVSAYVAYEKISFGYFVHRNPLFLIAMVAFLAGIQLLAFGLLAELAVRIYYESQGKRPYLVRKTWNLK